MYHDLRHQYYWNGMKQQVGDFVHRCLTCQLVKAEHQITPSVRGSRVEVGARYDGFCDSLATDIARA